MGGKQALSSCGSITFGSEKTGNNQVNAKIGYTLERAFQRRAAVPGEVGTGFRCGLSRSLWKWLDQAKPVDNSMVVIS